MLPSEPGAVVAETALDDCSDAAAERLADCKNPMAVAMVVAADRVALVVGPSTSVMSAVAVRDADATNPMKAKLPATAARAAVACAACVEVIVAVADSAAVAVTT
jgi:hypothetical protein